MSFYAYLQQNGGCDYTIGCGNLLITLKAQSLPEAAIELNQRIKDDGYIGEQQLSKILLIEGNSVNIDVHSIYDKIEKERQDEVTKKKEEHEKQEFERLRKKFG